MALSPSSFLSRSPLFPFSSPLHRSRLGTIGVSVCSSLSSDALALARLLCSALLSYLSYSQASDVRTHSPTYHWAARKGVWSKGSWPRARCFVLFYLFYCFFFYIIETLFLSHRFLLRGLIPARGMGWLWVPLDGYFLCFWTVGAFWSVCSEAVRAGSV